MVCPMACCVRLSLGRGQPRHEQRIGQAFQGNRAVYDLVGFSPRETGSSTRLRRASAETLKPASILGDDKLNYLGISYGTWLGTWYAGLFPERVGRMALIGNTDITAPLNDTLLSQEMGMRRVMDEILAPYAAENPKVFRLGASAEEVRQVFRSLRGNMLDVTSALLHETIAHAGEASVDLLGAAPVFGGAGRG